jgi:hypothetical protein
MEIKILWIVISVIIATLMQYVGKLIKETYNFIAFFYFYKFFIHVSISWIVYSGFKEYSIRIKELNEISDLWLIVGIVLVNILILLYNLGSKKYVFSKISQFDKRKINVSNIDGFDLKVLKNKSNKIILSWSSFGEGIEILKSQIHTAKNFDPDLYFGINESGIIIASYLSSDGRIPLGIIKTKGNLTGPRRDIQFTVPIEVIKEFKKSKEDIVVVLCDSEIKSGDSLQKYKNKIIKYLDEQINTDKKEGKESVQVQVHIAVLCGIDHNEKSHFKTITTNYFGNSVGEKYSPDFIAFYSNYQGFDPPGGIK